METDTDSSEDERDNEPQTLVRSKQPRPVQRVPPMKSQQVSLQDCNGLPGGSSEQSEPQSAKMLIFLPNSEQRLISFTLSKESCTLQEVLEQVNVPFSGDTHIQCMQSTTSEIDYFVSVGSTSRIEDLLENQPWLVGDVSSSEMSTPETSCPENSRHSPESPHTPRYVIGMLAECKQCGYTGLDFSRCERCKRVITEEPKSVPMREKKVEQKEPEKNNSGDGNILNVLNTTLEKLDNKTLTMDSDNSESGDDESNQNGRFDEHQITELLTSLKQVINILNDSLKKNRKKRKERKKLFKKETKKAEVYNARNEIQKLCKTIRDIGLPRGSLAEVVAGASSSQTESIPGTSRSCIKPVMTGTSKNHTNMIESHTDALTGTTQSHTQAVAGSSRSYTDPISGTSRCHTEAITVTSRSHTEAVLRTSMSQMVTVADTSRNLIEATAGNSRGHTDPTAVTSGSHTETTTLNSSIYTEATAGTSRNQIETVPGPSTSLTNPTVTETSINQKKIVTETSTNHTDPTVSQTSKDHRKKVTEPSTSRTDPTVTETPKNHKKIVTENSTSHTDPTVSQTSKDHRKIVTETSTSHTDPTVSQTSKDHRQKVTETSTSHTDPTVSQTSKEHRQKVTETSTSHADPTVSQTSKDHRQKVTETSTSHTDPTVSQTSKEHRQKVTETSTSHTDPTVSQTSKEHRQKVTETSTSHTDPTVTETLNNHKKIVTENSTSHTDPIVSQTSKDHRKKVTETSISHTDPTVTETSNNHKKIVTENSTSHTDPTVSQTSKDHRQNVTETSTNHTDPTVSQASKDHRKKVTETSTSHTDPTVTETLNNHKKIVTENSTSHTDPIVSQTSKDHRKKVTETSTSHTDPTVTETSNNHKKIVTENSTSHTDPTVSQTSKDHRQKVTETSTNHTYPTVSQASKDHRKKVTETSTSHTDPTVTETSNNHKKIVTENSTSHTDPTVSQTSKDHRKKVTETSTSHTEAPVSEKSDNQTKGVQYIHAKSVLVTPKTHTQVDTAGILKSHTKIQYPETSQTLNPGNTVSVSRPTGAETMNYSSASVFPETPRRHTEAVSQTPGSRTKTAGARISSTHTSPILTKTKKRRTQSASGILRSHTEPVETLKTHTKAIPGTSRSHADAITGNSKIDAEAKDTAISHTKDVNSETSVRSIEEDLINSLSKFEQDLAGTPNGQTKSVHRDSSIHIEAVSGTSRNNTEALSSLTSAAGTVAPDATTRNDKKGMPSIPKSNLGCVNPLDTLLETIRNYMDPILRGTTKDPTDVKLSNNSRNHKNVAVIGTSDRQITDVNVNIRGNDGRHKEITNLQARNETMKTSESDEMDNNTSATKRNTETSLKRNHANSNHDKPKRSRLDSKCSGKKTINTDNFEQHCTHHVMTHNKENYEHRIQKLDKRQDDINKNETQNDKVAKEKKSTETKKRTSRSESTPNGHIEQTIINLTLTQVSDIDISKKDADAKKRTAKRSNSTPNSHLEAANASTLAKNPITDKDSNKSYDERKRKSTENSAPSGRIADAEKAKKVEDDKKRKARKEKERKEMEKQDSTPKTQFSRASSSTLAKITNTDKDNKSSDERKRKPTTENSSRNGRIEETIINSTFKIGDTQKAKKAEDVKKSKAQKEKDGQGMDKPDSTLKRKIEEANSTLSNTTADKDNKTVDGNEKKTADKDLAPNGHIIPLITNRILTNAHICKKNKPADVKTKIETKPNFIANERKELANSTVTKIIDTNKKNKPSDGKKRKASGSDSGPSKKTISYSTIDLTSDNDEDELKLPTTAVKECSPKPAGDDKVINDQRIIDIDENTCFYEPTEDTKSTTAIKKSSPKLADKEQVLKEDQIIVIDENTCLYDPAKEKASDIITKSSPTTDVGDQILKDQQVIDISEDTCFFSQSEEKPSVPLKETRAKPADNDKVLKDQEVIDISDDTCSYEVSEQEASGATKKPRPKTETEVKLFHLEGEKASVTNQESDNNIKKYRTKLIKELEEKHAAELLAANVKREQATANQMNNAVVLSSFFPPQPNQKSNEGDHESTEQKTTNIKQGLQEKSLKNRHDKVALKGKKPYEKPNNNINNLNLNKVFPEVTITTKPPDISASTSLPTNVQQTTQIASQSNSTERRISNVPVIIPELSISILPNPITHANPNLSITSSMSTPIQQSAQIGRSDLPIATSGTTALEYRHTESRPKKPNPVTKASKRPSSELGPSPKRDAVIKPRVLKTSPIEKNAQPNQAVPPPDSEWRSIPLTKLLTSKHSSSGDTGTLLNNNFDPASRPTNPPDSTSHKTSHVDLAQDSNRGETSNHVQSPQIYWYKPFPFENLTPKQGTYRNLSSNVATRSDEHSNPKASAELNDPRKRSWHTPENDRANLGTSTNQSTLQLLPTIPESADQITTSTQSSSNPLAQSNLPLRPILHTPRLLSPTISEPVNQMPTSIQSSNPLAQSNLPLRPLLLTPRLQSTMIDSQRAPNVTQRTWHIPTEI